MKKLFAAALMLASFPMAGLAAVAKPVPVPGAEESGEFSLTGAYVNVYFIPSANVDFGSLSIDGDGFGLSGTMPLDLGGLPLFVAGEYQKTNYDNDAGDDELEQTRLGAGYQFRPIFGAYVEYVEFKDPSDSSDGWGIHGLFSHQQGPFDLYGSVGYLALTDDNSGDEDGLEFTLGASFNITPRFAAVADYRANKIEDDAGNEVTIGDFRVGARMNF